MKELKGERDGREDEYGQEERDNLMSEGRVRRDGKDRRKEK